MWSIFFTMHYPPTQKRRIALYSLLLYVLISGLYFGIGVINHPETHFVGFEADPALFTWMLN